MPWIVYLLQCADGSLYCGITKNLTERVAKHNAGTAAKYTRSRLPVVCVWHAQTKNESAARKKEAAIKRLPRLEKLALIDRASKQAYAEKVSR